MEKLTLVDDNCCFACGMDNLEGLRIEWKLEGRVMTGEFTPEKKYQGWSGVVHGGILATLLDEAMTRLAGLVSGGAVTAEMKVRYLLPATIGETLFIRGEIVNESRKILELKATLQNSSNIVVAHATGKAMII